MDTCFRRPSNLICSDPGKKLSAPSTESAKAQIPFDEEPVSLDGTLAGFPCLAAEFTVVDDRRVPTPFVVLTAATVDRQTEAPHTPPRRRVPQFATGQVPERHCAMQGGSFQTHACRREVERCRRWGEAPSGGRGSCARKGSPWVVAERGRGCQAAPAGGRGLPRWVSRWSQVAAVRHRMTL